MKTTFGFISLWEDLGSGWWFFEVMFGISVEAYDFIMNLHVRYYCYI